LAGASTAGPVNRCRVAVVGRQKGYDGRYLKMCGAAFVTGQGRALLRLSAVWALESGEMDQEPMTWETSIFPHSPGCPTPAPQTPHPRTTATPLSTDTKGGLFSSITGGPFSAVVRSSPSRTPRGPESQDRPRLWSAPS
jgi:hypothetical protein